jgi:3-oxoadipate enol-lactonase
MTLAHRVDGPQTAPALLFSSSLGTTWELWDGQVLALERDVRTIRYDHPGHGRSAVPDGPVTPAALADGVVMLLDSLGLERVSFCGLSLGGVVGMALAQRAPDRLDRLVLCCTSAYFGDPEGWYERARIVRAAGTAAVAERVLGRWFTERFRAEEADTVTRFREMLEQTTPEGYAACCEAIAAWDARSDLGAIATPTLVIVGEDDVATTPDDAAFLASSIPTAELVVVPGAAHLANVEQPSLFNRALLRHLSAAPTTVAAHQ